MNSRNRRVQFNLQIGQYATDDAETLSQQSRQTSLPFESYADEITDEAAFSPSFSQSDTQMKMTF